MGRFFGTDGIRGVVGQSPLTPDFFLRLGQAVGAALGGGSTPIQMVIGRDTRRSGQMLQNALTAGLLSSGIQVYDAGVIPTAGIAWLIRRLGLQAGSVISASHNPVEQNGVKFIDANGLKFSEALEGEIEKFLLDDQVFNALPLNANIGYSADGLAWHEYYKRGLLEEHAPNLLAGLRLVVDCSNGAASAFASDIFSRAGAEVMTTYASPTGQNINSGCGSEFVRRAPWEMGKTIQSHHADFGLAFDGDADRVVFVDELGNLIDGDHILGFLAQYLAQRGQLLGGAVVTTQMRNTGLKYHLEEAGLKVYETPVGDKFVVEKLLELRRQFSAQDQFGLGGEQAGHIDIVNDMFTTGDGIRTALFVMRAFRESRAATLSEFAAGVGKTPQIIASAYVGQGPRYDRAALADRESQLLTANPGLLRANLRYSGTEPLLRVMLESDGRQSELQLAEIAWKVCREAQQYAHSETQEIDLLNCTRGGVISAQESWSVN